MLNLKLKNQNKRFLFPLIVCVIVRPSVCCCHQGHLGVEGQTRTRCRVRQCPPGRRPACWTSPLRSPRNPGLAPEAKAKGAHSARSPPSKDSKCLLVYACDKMGVHSVCLCRAVKQQVPHSEGQQSCWPAVADGD